MASIADQLIEAQKYAGKSTFPEFLLSARNTGVISYDADFTTRNISYYGANGETYTEEYHLLIVLTQK